MKKPAKDPVRESRIHKEAIVDAYGPEEKAMSWYYYLGGKLSFPFRAKCTASKITSPLKKGEDVEVLRMAPDGMCATDMLVLVRWHDRKLAVPLAQLTAIDPDGINSRGNRRLALLGSARLSLLILLPTTHAHRKLTPELGRSEAVH
jgi:hypothetical protein